MHQSNSKCPQRRLSTFLLHRNEAYIVLALCALTSDKNGLEVRSKGHCLLNFKFLKVTKVTLPYNVKFISVSLLALFEY